MNIESLLDKRFYAIQMQNRETERGKKVHVIFPKLLQRESQDTESYTVSHKTIKITLSGFP